MNYKIAAVLLAFALTACGPATQTRGVSYIDPDYRDRRFESVVVEADKDNLQERTALEHAAVKELRERGIDAVASLDLVPPTRTYSAAKLRSVLRASGKQALLTIATSDKRLVEDYVPPSPSYYDRRRNRFPVHYGVGVGTSGIGYDGFVGGMVLHEPEAQYDVTLYALPSMNKSWTGGFTTRGPDGMSFETVGASFAGQLVDRLAADNMIAVTPE